MNPRLKKEVYFNFSDSNAPQVFVFFAVKNDESAYCALIVVS